MSNHLRCPLKGGNMSQNKMILQYMQEYGGITTYEAFVMFGCTRLPARISELKKDGHVITKKIIRGLNRYGQHTKYCQYELEKPA